MPPSEDNDTEWKDDIDDAGACPGPLLEPSAVCDNGGYVWCSTESESERLGGRSALLLLFEDNPAFNELIEGFRGGSGGALVFFDWGGDSRLMSGAPELNIPCPFDPSC